MLNYEQQYPRARKNRFIILHGVPYLVGEYVDRTRFDQIDQTMIGDGIIIDQSDPMRSIIDIQLSDIERRNSDGRLSTIGNSSKLENLIDIIKHDSNRHDSRLRVLRNGLLIRIFYQLENARTGVVLRSINESFRISDPNYFVYVNPEDISDNSLIVNFSDSKMTSVSQFTYGRDPMILRITGVQMFYEVVEMNPMKPRVERRVARDPNRPVAYYGPDADAYYYHQEMQNIHHFENSNWRLNRCEVPPEHWTDFNRFYHYDEELQNFQIHFDQVYDVTAKTIPLACGKIKLNKVFIVNPGSRLVFKFCIWKNDSVITDRCAAIADALRIPNTIGYSSQININRNPTYSVTPTIPYETYAAPPAVSPQSTSVDYAQNKVINQLIDVVASLELKISELTASTPQTQPGTTEPTETGGNDEPGSTEPGGNTQPDEGGNSEHDPSDAEPTDPELPTGSSEPSELPGSDDPSHSTPTDEPTGQGGETGETSGGTESVDPEPDPVNPDDSETP